MGPAAPNLRPPGAPGLEATDSSTASSCSAALYSRVSAPLSRECADQACTAVRQRQHRFATWPQGLPRSDSVVWQAVRGRVSSKPLHPTRWNGGGRSYRRCGLTNTQRNKVNSPHSTRTRQLSTQTPTRAQCKQQQTCALILPGLGPSPRLAAMPHCTQARRRAASSAAHALGGVVQCNTFSAALQCVGCSHGCNQARCAHGQLSPPVLARRGASLRCAWRQPNQPQADPLQDGLACTRRINPKDRVVPCCSNATCS